MKTKDYILTFLVIFLAIISWRVSGIYFNRYEVSYVDDSDLVDIHDKLNGKVYSCIIDYPKGECGGSLDIEESINLFNKETSK